MKGNRFAASPVATAVVLLLLTAHAFVVSATHFHRGRLPSAVASASPSAGEPGDAGGATPNVGHEQCLLCRLQRNLLSDLQHSVPSVVAPRPSAADFKATHLISVRRVDFSVPSGRGPPVS